MVKDATELLREWVPYNLLLGAAHIYIVNNDCERDASAYNNCSLLQPYIDAGSVTFLAHDFRCRRIGRATMLGALNDLLLRLAQQERADVEREWILEIDPDEYLVLPPFRRIPDYFGALVHQHSHLDAIPLPWRIFGNSFRPSRTLEGSVVANYRLRLPLALGLAGVVRLVESQKANDQVHPFMIKEMVRLPARANALRCKRPNGAHSHWCADTFDWITRNTLNSSSLDMGTEEQAPMAAAAADAFIHHYTYLSDEDWARKRARGRPRTAANFTRRRGKVDPLFSAVYDTTLTDRLRLLADSAERWSHYPAVARSCANALQHGDGYFGGRGELTAGDRTARPLAQARAALAEARKLHSRIGSEESARWLLEQRWAPADHTSRAPILAARLLGWDNETSASCASASRWLLARWNESSRVRSTAASVIARVVGAYPAECDAPRGARTPGRRTLPAALGSSSSCAGWTTIESERV